MRRARSRRRKEAPFSALTRSGESNAWSVLGEPAPRSLDGYGGATLRGAVHWWTPGVSLRRDANGSAEASPYRLKGEVNQHWGIAKIPDPEYWQLLTCYQAWVEPSG